MSAPLMRITGPFSGCEEFVTENAPLARYTWFKIGGGARWLVRPRSVEELQEATRRCIENNIPIYVLGLGANLLISDEGVNGAVFRFSEEHWKRVQFEKKEFAGTMVKVAAYNAQSWLADRLARHYLNTNDLHDLLRSFAHLSGTLIRRADGGVKVCLQPPDIPLQRRALAGLCADLNLGRPVFPGTGVPLHYEVAENEVPIRRRDNDRSPV